MTTLQSIKDIAKELKLEYNFTTYEALTLAIQVQRNQILENGLVVSRNDSNPTALEAIAIALGYDKDINGSPIHNALSDISGHLETITQK